MAPEQVENAAASPAGDLWSLGATLFNAVTGRPPFQGPDQATVLLTLLTQEPPTPMHAGPLAPLITAGLGSPSRSSTVGARSESSPPSRSEAPSFVTTRGTGFVVWAVCGLIPSASSIVSAFP